MAYVHYKAALGWLKELRAGTSRYADFLKYIAEDVEQGRYTLVELCTSQGELEALRKLGCKTEAQEALEALRAGPTSSAFTKWELGYVGLKGWQMSRLLKLLLSLKKDTLSCADVGTSADELLKLCGAIEQEKLNAILSR